MMVTVLWDRKVALSVEFLEWSTTIYTWDLLWNIKKIANSNPKQSKCLSSALSNLSNNCDIFFSHNGQLNIAARIQEHLWAIWTGDFLSDPIQSLYGSKQLSPVHVRGKIAGNIALEDNE